MVDGRGVMRSTGPTGGRIKVRAMVTPRVGRGVVWTPFHFGGWFEGKDLESTLSRRHGPYRARRGLQHRHHLWLRLGDPDAGDQGHPVPDPAGIKGAISHGTNEISV